MTEEVKQEVEKLIKKLKLNCSVDEFKDKVGWVNRVNWVDISIYQKLSEPFIREFKDEVNWVCISRYQILSEAFIREFKDKLDWDWFSKYQKLSDSLLSHILKNYKEEYIAKVLYKNKHLSQAKKNMIEILTGVKQ